MKSGWKNLKEYDKMVETWDRGGGLLNERFGAVLAAGGSSSRMGAGRSKVLLDLDGGPVLLKSLGALLCCGYIQEVCIVCREEDIEEISRLASVPGGGMGQGKKITFAPAGADRQESVRNGVQALSEDCGYLIIHDGARPFVSGELLNAVCRDALSFGAATAAVPCKDTCKLSDREGFVESTPPRDRLMAVQTPQAFKRELYMYAIEKARARGKSYTDDCQLVEAAGGKVRLTPGSYTNFKLTTPEDMLLARAVAGEGRVKGMRIGSGYDVHRLAPGRRLILGGVEIPYELGLLGHSDADVLAHAVSDAILGAAAMGDIGKLFPDDDSKYEGADSLKLLSEVCERARSGGFEIGNIDSTVTAQRPKLAPYIDSMRENIAAACGIDPGRVSVKATTEEGLGFTGRGEGIAASAVCLLRE